MSKAVGNLAGFFSREAQPQLICLFTVHSAVSASPWAFLTCRQKRWCVFQGQAGRMCRGEQRLLGMEPVPSVCHSRERAVSPHAWEASAWLSLAALYLGLFPTRAGRRPAVPAPAATPRLGILWEWCEPSPCHPPSWWPLAGTSLAAAR